MDCIICGQNNWLKKYDKLKKCKYCGLVRADDKYFKIQAETIYTDQYFNGLDYLNYASEEVALKSNFSNRIDRIKKFKQRGKLLDVGCAYGYFLEVANRSGLKATGIELDKYIAKKAAKQSGSNVLCGDFEKMKIKKGSFDVITMLDTIEHFQNPDAYIKKAYQSLKNGGIVTIETGNIEALLPRIQKNKWRLITPPTHLYYFSPKTLALLLEMHGFKVKVINNVGFYRTLGQTIYRLTRNKRMLTNNFITNFTFPLYTFDLMFLIAQK